MLTDMRIINKLRQVVQSYTPLRFESILKPDCKYAQTKEHYRTVPTDLTWEPAPVGTRWGGNWVTAWFVTQVEIPEVFDEEKVWVKFYGGKETMFLRNGEPWGVFDENHPYVCLTTSAVPGTSFDIAFEAYSMHDFPGCMPFDTPTHITDDCQTFGGVEIALEREDVSAFIYDLMVLIQLVDCLDGNSLRRGEVIRGLAEVFKLITLEPDKCDEDKWRPALVKAREVMSPLLDATNGSTAPFMGLIGHSHMDTAWLWPINETWRKVARTSSSIANLMEQYPEFLFIQSSPCHTEQMRRLYPSVYEQVKRLVADGRYELNGGMWVEADCNLTGGEALVRQFVFGQLWTREYLNYSADTLWLPDVFGYSAALPQILKGTNIKYFCTTKMAWNDTTRFPFDTFHWQGIDGTSVVAHLNSIHCWPDPASLTGQWNWVQHKDIQDRRYTAFGFGDGGGGPQHEMCEIARRVKDLEGCPRAEYMTVSDFMQGIERDLGERLPTWVGELYLEMHRGTLTSISPIKQGNRLCELALRDAEMLLTWAKLAGMEYPCTALREQWEILLINQFHDILPGSSIAEVNDQAIAEFKACQAATEALSVQALDALAGPAQCGSGAVLLTNTLNWDRSDVFEIPALCNDSMPNSEGVVAQIVTDVTGAKKLAISGVTVPALGSVVLPLGGADCGCSAPFTYTDTIIETPFYSVRLDEAGGIESLVCRETGREWVACGGVFNEFLCGEDIPSVYDAWEIEPDQELKMQRETRLVKREVVTDGPVQMRLYQELEIGEKSRLRQHVVFYADSPRIDFDTEVDWDEQHRLLKASFDMNIQTEWARHEIQYGHAERATHDNLPGDRARFEVCNHKWSDLSDNGSGIAILNDCKYGISVDDNKVGLSLFKAGTHPDPRADRGTHHFVYSLLPHDTPFNVPAVVRPAYELNVPVLARPVAADTTGFNAPVTVIGNSVILEAVKWAESGDAFILRLYEAGKMTTAAKIKLNVPVKQVLQTNMLEEDGRQLSMEDGAVTVNFHPFEIVTLRCEIS